MTHLSLCLAFFIAAVSVSADSTRQNPDQTEDTASLPKDSEKALPAPGTSVHLSGTAKEKPHQDKAGTWRCDTARIGTPLPEGYPAPTAPGCVELKSYPVVRRAKVEGKIAPDLASNFGFWKLFTHIKSRDIAMTSPVEMEYDIDIGAPSPKVAGWAMSFLYRTPELGPTGIAGAVVVEDEARMSFISVGFQGGYGVKQLTQRIDQLKEELAKHPHLELAGKPRALFYNGPEVRSPLRWGEAQLPVRIRNNADSAKESSDDNADSESPSAKD
ncbi:MAG: heme-binding protein [Planctomycetota bacterium]